MRIFVYFESRRCRRCSHEEDVVGAMHESYGCKSCGEGDPCERSECLFDRPPDARGARALGDAIDRFDRYGMIDDTVERHVYKVSGA